MDAVISIVGSILGSLAGKASEYAVDPIARQLGYLLNHKGKLQNLKGQVQELKDSRERVHQSVNEASRKGEEIFDYVDRWLKEVSEKISEEAATQLEKDEEKATKRCLVLCPNFKSRYQLSKKAEEEASSIAELLEKANQFGTVSYRPRPQGTATRRAKDYMAFDSRSYALNGIMEALRNADLSRIGVYGMGGVGKTTLVRQVATLAKEKNLFGEVVMAAVTQNFEIRKIQDQFADALGFEFKGQSDSGRASQLLERLKKDKKVLVILDDIWVELDLESIGIPSCRGEHEGCKILMTSRELNVLALMDSQKNLAIEILKEEEAWNLFEKMAGDNVLKPYLNSTAIEVAKKCAGLPVAIVTVGKAMRNKKHLFEWQNALRELSRPNFKGISAAVYSAIELSYKNLEDKEHQTTFLLCSIMGHDASIEHLVRYGVGLGLFDDLNTIFDARNKVLSLVSSLKSSCLLLDDSTTEHFDMHNIVRDVGISIASRDQDWHALGEHDGFREWHEQTMKNFELISLHQRTKVCELNLDRELEFPNLTFFHMAGGKDSSLKIPDNFLKGMQSLNVLAFEKMYFSPLPSSIKFLKSLVTLCLSGCDLKDIVIIGELKNLEVLDFHESKVEMLPSEIGQLSKLKLLDVSDCHHLKIISPNVLSRLSRLEELYLYGSFDGWEVGDGHDEKRRSNASLSELQHLSYLTTLKVHIPDERALPKDDSFFGKLERYKISIGKWWLNAKFETSRMLSLNQNVHLNNGVQTLLKKGESLCLEDVKDVILNMFYDLHADGFQHLKHLWIYNVAEIKYIINSMKLVRFALLESLSLCYLMNLETIFYDQRKAAGSFGELRVIVVQDCNMLKNLFSFSIIRELRQLEEIDVKHCDSMTQLIEEKRDEEEIGDDELVPDILVLNQLRTLKLDKLPRLSGVSYSFSEQMHSSTEREGVQSVNAKSNATSLFDQKVLFPEVKELNISLLIVEKLWHIDQQPVTGFGVQNLTTLKVYGCHNLKYLFSWGMVESFEQLNTLSVEKCNGIEEVILTEGLMEEERTGTSSVRVFPKLNFLRLISLGNLKIFSSGSYPIKFPFLRELLVRECPDLSTFHSDSTRKMRKFSTHNLPTDHRDVSQYLFHEKVAVPLLETLTITEMKNLERLWPNQLADEESFAKLIELELSKCRKLRNVFPLSMLRRLQSLNTMIIRDCDLVEDIIFEPQQGSASPKPIRSAEFPQLTYLTLTSLPNLKTFCPKLLNIKWPLLKGMEVCGCHQVEIFFQQADGMSREDIPDQHPLFWVNKLTFPNLEELILGWNGRMKKIWHGHVNASECFCRLKAVVLRSYPRKLSIFPSYLFQFLMSLPNLQSLEISEAYFEEIFKCKVVGDEEKPSSAWVVVSRLTELKLTFLHDLMHLWKETERFQNLRILQVIACRLHNYLVPSTVSFENLETLNVESCHGIIKLIAHSTARSLVNLQRMRISYCREIEEIIEDGDDEDEEVRDKICFVRLKLLELRVLPKLESFCSSGNYTFEFPSLETVIVEHCPKMKMFSQEESYTLRLHKVLLNRWDEEERWSGSLESTIKQMFKEHQQKSKLDSGAVDDEHFAVNGESSKIKMKSNEDEVKVVVKNSKEDKGQPSRSTAKTY